jgi:phosphate acetyltransferase
LARSVYVTALEPQSGKSVVALGLVEMLSARTERIGFFRPVVPSDVDQDPQIGLIRGRYGVEAEGALSDAEAQSMIAAGDAAEVEKRVMEAYRELQNRCDVVVCEGTDFTGAAPALDFDLNARLANALDSPVLVVVRGGSADEATAAVKVARESLEQKGCELFGVIVGRVPLEVAAQVVDAVAPQVGERPVYVLVEQPELAFPTVGDVASALDADLLFGAPDGLQREVREVRVAAMDVGHFLGDLVEGTLVIVPGDRADILLASLISTYSRDIPAVAGVVLTAGYEPDVAVRKLLEGTSFPVLQVPERTYSVATKVHAVEPAMAAGSERKIASALGVFQSGVDPLELEERMALERPARVTPLMFEYELIERAKEGRQHIVLPEGDDLRVLQAADILLRRGVVSLTILGDPDEIRARSDALGRSLTDHRAHLVDPQESPLRQGFAERYHELRKHKGVTEELAFETMGDVTYFGTMMVSTGEADGMVSGAAHTTGDTIRPAFEIIKPRKGVSVVSSVFLMCLPDRVLVYGDCAVNPKPNQEQLADIAISSADTAFSFGIEPRVAMLSYSTGESGKGEDVDLVRGATALVRERRPDLLVEGPIQYDAAVDPEVAAKKLPGSELAGQATVFIFPDLATGNIAYKAVQRSADAVAVGPVLQGLNKPVNDLSRGCLVPDIVSTVVITAIQAQEVSGRSTSRLRMKLPTT